MKKLLTFFLVLQFFSNHEAFAELVKFPFLFDHYHQTASDKSLIDFMKEHYADSNHNDDHEHGKLPFKHSDDGCSHHPSPNISVVIKSDTNFSLALIEYKLHQIIISNDQIPSSIAESIWQPPKLA